MVVFSLNGMLLVSPIKEPGEKAMIEVVGRVTSLVPAVVECVALDAKKTEIKAGDVVYFIREVAQNVALDLGCIFLTIHENDVRLFAKAEQVGKIEREDTSPAAVKAFMDKQQAIQQEMQARRESEERAAKLTSGLGSPLVKQ